MKSHYHRDLLKWVIGRKIFDRDESVADRSLYLVGIRLSRSHYLLFDGVETEVLLSACAQQLGH